MIELNSKPNKTSSIEWVQKLLNAGVDMSDAKYCIGRTVPTAMDVYQGKTDIEYIYKDGKVVDSTVVFKNIVYCR